MKSDKKYTYVTLLSTDSYLMGVLLLAKSLRKVDAHYPLLVVCSIAVSDKSKRILARYGLEYVDVDKSIAVDSGKYNVDAGHAHWNHTFDKLYIWAQTQYDKVVFLDSDMQVIRNIDYLFDMPHMSAVRADQWNEPGLDKLNSGLMVVVPNRKDFEGLLHIVETGSLSMANIGDQDIIRAYYSDWGTHPELTLHPGLNVLYSEISHKVIKEENVSPVSVIHYIGQRKPWMVSPRAIWRRSRNNFLGKHLLRYAKNMYVLRIKNCYYELCKK